MTDKDIDKKLKKMEEQLDVITSSLASRNPDSSFSNPDSRFPPLDSRIPAAGRSDEIDLRELFDVLWRGKWWIVGITFLFAVAGAAYALSLPNMYKSEGVYAPTQKEGAAGGMAGQLGGLASLAGVSLGGGESNDIDQAMALITSWPFLEKVINKHDLKPLIMGVKGWNREADELIWNDEIYDHANKKWLREPTDGKKAEPSSYEVYKQFEAMLNVKNDTKVGLLTIGVEHYSPIVAKNWVELIVKELNVHFKNRDKVEAQSNIDYLETKVGETGIAEMQAVFYGMIEAQIKTLMLAEVGDEYLIRSVVEAKASELKSKPKRSVLVLLSIISGGFLSVLFVFLRALVKKNV